MSAADPRPARPGRHHALTASLLVGVVAVIIACAGAAPTLPPSVKPFTMESPTPAATPTRTMPATATAPPTTPPSPSGSPSLPGVEGLVRDLEAAGAKVTAGDRFDAAPLAPAGLTVCVDGEDINVYVYESVDERIVAARRIDPTDPTNIGTSIIEWDGAPKFWGRENILVLYLGQQDVTTALLTRVLGESFAHGLARPRRLPGIC